VYIYIYIYICIYICIYVYIYLYIYIIRVSPQGSSIYLDLGFSLFIAARCVRFLLAKPAAAAPPSANLPLQVAKPETRIPNLESRSLKPESRKPEPDPNPATRNPKPGARSPKSGTQTPKFETRSPKSEARSRDSKPETRNGAPAHCPKVRPFIFAVNFRGKHFRGHLCGSNCRV